ncbi:MAG TPA: SCO family protein [Solirubrobacteraceae bacterium]
MSRAGGRHIRHSWLAILCAVALAGCGATAAASGPGNQGAVTGHGLQGLILKPRKPAPALVLHNYTSPAPVSLARFRGKAVLVSFVYTHCPNVCPIITANLAAAQRQLGSEARHLQILLVTVDPRRDTPAAIRTFLGTRDATGRMDYLLGSIPALHRVWKAWDVGVETSHGYTAGHSSIVYGITATGRMAVVYPSNFSPVQIVHDVPLLASS